jgi:tetratricopeptide (TPR) repeat protein
VKATKPCGISLLLLVSFVASAAIRISAAGNQTSWIQVRSPNFIVVTNANGQEARRVAYQFELIRAVYKEFFGPKRFAVEQPIVIIAAKDENTLKALLPQFWEKKGLMHPAGVYQDGADVSYVLLRLDVSMNQEASQPFEPVYHEYIHYLMRRTIAQLPLWMVEGLAEFYGNTRVENKRVLVGAPSYSNVMLLRQKQLLPVTTLFEIDAFSPYYHEESKTSIFYAESWALTHYLMVRDGRDKTHRVQDFIEMLWKGIDAKEAATKTIGDPKVLEDALRSYVQNSAFRVAAVDPPKIDESGFQTSSMSDAESLAVRADFMAHDRHFAQAQQMLEEAIKADSKLGAAYENMGFLYLQQGNMLEAEKWATQAVTLNPQSYRANYCYAASLLQGGHHDEESLRKAEASLRTAVKVNPDFTPAYAALGYALSLPGPNQKLDEAYSVTQEAVQREPANVQYRIRAAEVLERQGRAEDAIRVTALAVSIARTPNDRDAASAALAGANQFKISQEKMKEAERAQASHPLAPVTSQDFRAPTGVPAQGGIEVLSNTMGVDFGPYLNKEVLEHCGDRPSRAQRSGCAPVPLQPRGS